MTISKLFFWFFDKISSDLQVYAVTNKNIQKMQILAHEKRMLVVSPTQMIDI